LDSLRSDAIIAPSKNERSMKELMGNRFHRTFWQAIKYHPDTTIADVPELIAMFQSWLARLDDDWTIYFPKGYR
jgi:hypothetical protein